MIGSRQTDRSRDDHVQSLDQEVMFSRQDPGLKRRWGIALEDGHTTLRDDWTLIVLRIDEVNRHTCFRVPGGQNGFVHMNPVLALSSVLR